MELTAEDFANTNGNFANVTFVIKDGQLVIKPIDVTVTITEHSDEVDYNGEEHTVTGYDVEVSNKLYTEQDFTFSGNDSVSGTDAGSYDMELTAEDFANTNGNFATVTFEIEDGQLVIKPIDVTVTITENSDEVMYDGEEHTVTGYEVTSISSELYTVDDFAFNGNDSVSGTDAGSYDMELTAEDFANTNNNFATVTFEIVNGQLIINPYDVVVTVQITGKNDTVLYDGQAHGVKGYDITINNASADVPEEVELVTLNAAGNVASLLTVEDIILVGSDEVSATNAGTYAQGLAATSFENTNPNFSNVVFEVTDGNLEITKRQVTLTSADGSKVYDGTALKNKKISVSGDGFAEGEGATYKVTGSITEVGTAKNKFTYTLKEGTLADNYEIKTVFGKLEITPKPADPTPEDPTPTNPTPAPTPVIIEDDPVPMADGPVPDDGPAVLGARREGDAAQAVLGARRGTEYAVLGKRRRPNTGDNIELILWYVALGMSMTTAIAAAMKVRKNKAD